MYCPIRYCASGRLVCCRDCNRGEVCVHACQLDNCQHVVKPEPPAPECPSILDRYHSKENESDAPEGGEVN